jgi:hypothetical protein
MSAAVVGEAPVELSVAVYLPAGEVADFPSWLVLPASPSRKANASATARRLTIGIRMVGLAA